MTIADFLATHPGEPCYRVVFAEHRPDLLLTAEDLAMFEDWHTEYPAARVIGLV